MTEQEDQEFGEAYLDGEFVPMPAWIVSHPCPKCKTYEELAEYIAEHYDREAFVGETGGWGVFEPNETVHAGAAYKMRRGLRRSAKHMQRQTHDTPEEAREVHEGTVESVAKRGVGLGDSTNPPRPSQAPRSLPPQPPLSASSAPVLSLESLKGLGSAQIPLPSSDHSIATKAYAPAPHDSPSSAVGCSTFFVPEVGPETGGGEDVLPDDSVSQADVLETK